MPELIAPYEYSMGYVILPVELPALPPTLKLGGITYHGKTHYHCSLIAIKKITPQLVARNGSSESEPEVRILTLVSQILATVRPAFKTFGSEFRIAEKPSEQKCTLIIVANITGLAEIFSRLNHELELEIPVQPAHVTLYTMSNGYNIGLTSPAEMATKSRPLTPAETQELEQQVSLRQMLGVAL